MTHHTVRGTLLRVGLALSLAFGATHMVAASSIYVDSHAVTTASTTSTQTSPTTVETTTVSTTLQSLDFNDPTWLNGADRMGSLSFQTVAAGLLKILPHGATDNSKLVVGALGLGVDSCNVGIVIKLCGLDNDVDVYLKNGKLQGEAVTFLFDKTVTLKTADIVDGVFGGNTFGISVDGGSVQSVLMGSWGLWSPVGLSLTGKSFTFSVYNPAGLKSFDDFYISGLSFTTTSSTTTVTQVPEASSAAMALAGLGVAGFIGGRRRRT